MHHGPLSGRRRRDFGVTPAGHAVSRHVQSGGCWAASQAGRAREDWTRGPPRGSPGTDRMARAARGEVPRKRRTTRRAWMARKTRITRITTLPHVPGGPAENWRPAPGLDPDGQPAQRRAAALHRSPDSDGVHRLCAAGLRGATLRAGKSDAGAPSPAGPPPVRYGKRWRPTDKSQGRLEPATRPADRFFSRRRLPAFTGEACG